MRRTAALLTIAAFLQVYAAEDGTSNNLGTHLWTLASTGLREPASPLMVAFLPLILIAASALGSRPPVPHLLQILGSLFLLLVWAWIVTRSDEVRNTLYSSVPLLGMSWLSLGGVFARMRRRPDPDPERRFAAALLALLATMHLAWAVHVFDMFGDLGARLRWPIAYLAGTGVALALLAWAAWTRQGWAPWMGILATGCLFCKTLWGMIQSIRGIQGGRAEHVALYVFSTLPSLLLLAIVAGLLARRLRRPRPPTDGSPPSRPRAPYTAR
jgi:hypothetical protein